MSTYRVKMGFHSIGGTILRAGDTFEIKDKKFVPDADHSRLFEMIATPEKSKPLGPENDPVGPEGVNGVEGIPAGPTGPMGGPGDIGANGATGPTGEEGDDAAPKKRGRKPKAGAEGGEGDASK